MGKIFGLLMDFVNSQLTNKDIDALHDAVRSVNYELSMLRYKDSDDEDIRLAYEYLRKRPQCTALFPYEKTREIPDVDVQYDKLAKMCYVMHNGHPLYFPKGEKEKLVRLLYRYSIAYDDILGSGYHERNPHACQSERYHIEAGDVLIDAGGWTILEILDDSSEEMLDFLKDDVVDMLRKKELEIKEVEFDVGTARGLLALDVIDKVSQVYVVERASRWWKPLEATFAPFKDKVELVKGELSASPKRDKKKKIHLVDLLEKCGQQRVFVMMDLEGDELEVLRDAQEYLQAATNPIVLAVCAYHRPSDYDELLRFFETIGYHTETQPGYMYTDMNAGHGAHSLRRGLIRASNR